MEVKIHRCEHRPDTNANYLRNDPMFPPIIVVNGTGPNVLILTNQLIRVLCYPCWQKLRIEMLSGRNPEQADLINICGP